ncbi:MAG: hypothetical protein IPJ52_01950 [Rhodocyclaceae bacterium]|nr:hypothetical protein [Rhodocyclaceae bacterium]
MTPQGKKIWDSKAGGDLAMAMMGEKPMTEEDRKTLASLKQTSSTANTDPRKNSSQATPRQT